MKKAKDKTPPLFVGSDKGKNPTKSIIRNESGLMIGTKKYYQTPEDLESKIDEYFLECEEKGKMPNHPGLARYLGFNSRTALWNYEHQESHKEFHEVIERAKNRLCEHLEDFLLSGKNNPAGGIFLAKNYGYVDKVEVDTKGQYITQMIPVPPDEPQTKTISIDGDQEKEVSGK